LTIWKPDTCDCKIEYNADLNHIKTFVKCRLHQPLKNQDLLNAVIAYNQSFNLAFGAGELSKEEETIISLSKSVTKMKIRQGDFSELPPIIANESIITRLRNFLRR